MSIHLLPDYDKAKSEVLLNLMTFYPLVSGLFEYTAIIRYE